MNRARIAIWIRSVSLACVLALASLSVSGCGTPEETPEAVNRRHRHILWNNLEQVQSDVDAYFLLDKPSKLSDRTIR